MCKEQKYKDKWGKKDTNKTQSCSPNSSIG